MVEPFMQGLPINLSDARKYLSWEIVNMKNEHKPMITLSLYLDEIMKEKIDFLINGSQNIFG